MTAALLPVEPSRLDDVVADAVRHVRTSGRRVWIKSTAAATWPILIERIQALVPHHVTVDPPPLHDADAALHALLQAAAGAGAIQRAIDDQPLRIRARTIGDALADEGRVLIFRLPTSWLGGNKPDDPDGRAFYERARDVIHGLLSASTLTAIFFGPGGGSDVPDDLGLEATSRSVGLRSRLLEQTQLAQMDARIFGEYEDSATKILKALQESRASITPSQLGLLVGLVVLGERPEVIAKEVALRRGKGTDFALRKQVGQALDRRSGADPLRVGLCRAAQARFPLPRKLALAISGLPAEHEPFLTVCLGLGALDSDSLRIDEVLRAIILPRSSVAESTDACERLANHYQSLDGAYHPSALTDKEVIPWLEKVHNLARMGPQGAARWGKHSLPSPEFYWDYGRALSIEHKRYLDAAAVYEASAQKFPEDDYSWHYLAWNLDQAGRYPSRVEEGYREAIRLKEANRWWNSRLVTFLIERTRFKDAEIAWEEALERLDPEGVLVQSDESLVHHVHHWVVDAWLDAAEVERARAVFNEIPQEMIKNSRRLQELEWRLCDAEEAAILGESVYPAGLEMEKRWKKPEYIRDFSQSGAPLLGWYPGVVVESNRDRVSLVFALPEAELGERRLIRVELSAHEWHERGGWCPPEDAHGLFVMLASYGRGEEADEETLYRVEVKPPPWQERLKSSDHRLRYLRSWARETRGDPSGTPDERASAHE